MREKVKSSTIATVEYLHEPKEMVIEFRSGASYRYFGVEYADYRDMMAADSIGKHFSAHIRDKFEYKRVLPADEEKAPGGQNAETSQEGEPEAPDAT